MRSTPRRLHVCSVDELPPGSHIVVPDGRHSIGVYNVGGRFFAVLNRCPHAGAPLCRGRVTGLVEARGPGFNVAWTRDGEIIRCPWHARDFELDGGRSISDPRVRVKTYPVAVEHGQVFAEVGR